MELKLVYRILRKISEWAVTGYYSETFVEGQENVPLDGPLIVASTHHNEIIDIATLTVTMPHRRHVSFWAKSTMFANPIARAVLSSSGAIPVKRNPNSSPQKNMTQDPSSSNSLNNTSGLNESAARTSLFRDTTHALAKNDVIGVFPEGTSYTQASIIQVLPGAAWAAVEYARYVHEHGAVERPVHGTGEAGKGKGKAVNGSGLRIVPVAIVYTDKSRYLSRVSVKYGKPISIDSYAAELFDGKYEENSKSVVKKVASQVEKQMRDMTINAVDWDTVCAVSMTRSILWEDEDKIPMKDWVQISQRLVRIFDDSPELSHVLKVALTKYYSLLHYANIKHSILLSLLPLSAVTDMMPLTSPQIGLLVRPTTSMLTSLPLALAKLVLFTPAMLLYLPGYFTGLLAKKCLAQPGEEEAVAQFKAVGGGLGVGANIGLALGIGWELNKIGTLAALLGLTEDDDMIKKTLLLAGIIYIGVVLLIRWHRLLVKSNYRTLQRLFTYCKLISAVVFPRSSILSAQEVDTYSRPPLPATNAFIRKRTPSSPGLQSGLPTPGIARPRHIPPRKLIILLLQVRMQACNELKSYLRIGNEELVEYLLGKGAKI